VARIFSTHLGFTLACLFIAGCASYRTSDFSNRPAHTLPNRQESKGLVVAASVYSTADAVRRHFGPDLWKAGFFPVVVYLENRGQSTFELERDQFEIWPEVSRTDRDANPAALAPANPIDLATECRRSTVGAYFLSPLLVFPAVWAHRRIEQYNFDFAEDLESKALPVYYRIEPGDPPVRGAVFFPRPVDIDSLDEFLENAELRVVAKAEGSKVAPTSEADSRAVHTASGKPQKPHVGESTLFILSLSGGQE